MSWIPHDRRRTRMDDLKSTAASMYLDALLLMGRQAAEIFPQAGEVAQETLLRLRRRLSYVASSAIDYEDAHDVVHDTMREFARQARQGFDAQQVDLARLQTLAHGALELFSARDRAHMEQLKDVMQRLQNVAADPGTVRGTQRACEQAAFALMRITEEFEAESIRARERLSNELAPVIRPAVAERETGWLPRSTMESRLREAVETGRRFSILKLGVHEFSGLDEQHGTVATRVLRQSVAGRLGEQIRPHDLLGEWDDRNFLLLLPDCVVATAELRGDEIAAWLSGEYRLVLEGEAVGADVQLTAAATEPRPDESPNGFLARAEALSPVALVAH